MIDPIQTGPRQWHYPQCERNDITDPWDRCPRLMFEQIQQMHLEMKIMAHKNLDLSAEISRLERLNNA